MIPQNLKPVRLMMILNLLIFFFTQSYSQPFPIPGTEGYMSLGIYSKKNLDAYSCNSNPAGWMALKGFVMAFGGGKNYMLEELGTYTVFAGMRTKQGSIAVSGNYFGYHYYNQSAFGIAFAKAISEKMKLGLKVNYNGLHISGYGNSKAINFEMGFVIDLSPSIRFAWYTYNPLESKWESGGGESIHSIYRVGLGYIASEQLLTAFEIQKESLKPILIRCGIRYQYSEKLNLGISVEMEPVSLSFGIGFQLKQFHFEIAVIYKQPLGFSPDLLLSFIQQKN